MWDTSHVCRIEKPSPLHPHCGYDQIPVLVHFWLYLILHQIFWSPVLNDVAPDRSNHAFEGTLFIGRPCLLNELVQQCALLLPIKYKEGRLPLEGPPVKDISQDHKSSGSSRLSSDHEWRTLIWTRPWGNCRNHNTKVPIVLVIFLVLTGDSSSCSNSRESSSKKMNESRWKGSLWLGCPISRWQATLCFGVLACVLERLSIYSIRASESAKRL